mmetsp:Transcript_35078/g.105497  ORF Transcript_35078/g.105497 Transcript_35078/m.105497 type:complete len:288 (+) Transcript_35078:877-1740(+)
MVHHANLAAAEGDVRRRLGRRPPLRRNLHQPLDGQPRLPRADGPPLPRHPRRHLRLHLRQPPHPQGAAPRPPLSRRRPHHHAGRKEARDVLPLRAAHRPLHALRDPHPLPLWRRARRLLLALPPPPHDDGARRRPLHRLHLPRAAAQRALPAGAADRRGARRADAARHHHRRGQAGGARRGEPHRLAAGPAAGRTLRPRGQGVEGGGRLRPAHPRRPQPGRRDLGRRDRAVAAAPPGRCRARRGLSAARVAVGAAAAGGRGVGRGRALTIQPFVVATAAAGTAAAAG